MIRTVSIAALLVLAACARQEEPVANRFDRTTAEIENKARELEAETENQVRAIEAEREAEGNAFIANQLNLAMPVEANQATANRAR